MTVYTVTWAEGKNPWCTTTNYDQALIEQRNARNNRGEGKIRWQGYDDRGYDQDGLDVNGFRRDTR